jgi:hypothetical protein
VWYKSKRNQEVGKYNVDYSVVVVCSLFSPLITSFLRNV